jgi:C4-dicarboxylate transporter DctM subunit
MSLEVIAIIGIFLLLALMFLRMPIAVAMALAGFIGLCLARGIPPALGNLATTAFRNATSYQLSMIPLFILMGELAFYGGLSKDAFTTLHKWVGHLRGGLAIATVGACAAFGACVQWLCRR